MSRGSLWKIAAPSRLVPAPSAHVAEICRSIKSGVRADRAIPGERKPSLSAARTYGYERATRGNRHIFFRSACRKRPSAILVVMKRGGLSLPRFFCVRRARVRTAVDRNERAEAQRFAVPARQSFLHRGLAGVLITVVPPAGSPAAPPAIFKRGLAAPCVRIRSDRHGELCAVAPRGYVLSAACRSGCSAAKHGSMPTARMTPRSCVCKCVARQ